MRMMILSLVLALQQAPSPQQIRDSLEAIERQMAQLIEQIPKAPPITTAAELQKALDAGGTVQLPKGMSYTGTFTIAKSGTILLGNGSGIAGTNGPALAIKPGVFDVDVSDLVAVSSGDGAVIQCGENGGAQTAAAQMPARITLRNVTIPTHRGKRGIEWNCAGAIIGAMVADVWATSLADSQALWIGNTCGPVTVTGGTFTAASENILIGGDTLKITDCPEKVAADILLDGVTLLKPEAWRTDGVKRAVKNILELKAGKRVLLRDAKLSGSWGPAFGGAQDGSAIVITPKNSQYIADVTIENVDIDRAAGCFQLLGKDYNSVTPQATAGIAVHGLRCTGMTKAWGGRGIFALVVEGMQGATFDQVTFSGDGNAIIICDTKVPVGPLAFTNSTMTTGPYGVMAPGVNFGSPTPLSYAGRECVTTFTGNTFTGAPSTFKKNYPTNTYQ